MVWTSFCCKYGCFWHLVDFPLVCWHGFQSAPWKRWRAQLSTRPAISRRTADSIPTPKVLPCRRSTGAPTRAPSLKQKSLPTGRSCAWSPARGSESVKTLAEVWAAGHKERDGTLQGLTASFNTAATFIILLISGWEIATRRCYHHDRLYSQEVSRVEAAASVHWKSFTFRPLSSPFFSLFFGSPPSVFTV